MWPRGHDCPRGPGIASSDYFSTVVGLLGSMFLCLLSVLYAGHLSLFSFFKKKWGGGEVGDRKKAFAGLTRVHLQLGGICSPHVTSLINKQLN